MCCSICHYKNIDNNHKIILFADEESLKKENITIDKLTEKFNINIEKQEKLKKNIEKEIVKINNLYEEINKGIANYYLEKHEKLIKEDNNLKEKLDNEVTKIKEKLENYLFKSDNLLKICEKIKKGIKNLENQQKNMIKNLSYITKINKTQIEMEYLFQQLMRNVKINFIKENDEKLKFEDYYFNGICKPKDVLIKYITDCSINLFWKTDDINILNIDKKQLKYIVEIKKKNKNFKRIYEGGENSCKIENLKNKTEYELRICTTYNEVIGDWTEIKTFKTSEISCDNIILLESKKKSEYLKKII